ncbi:DNA polymerase-4 [Caldanaerobius fijiensis DSM 17918]|uniref:DNA polymerase IV n=1 Tax=Caldanaerobius fijiensis DSM 17918 TaxID=1121256 RepID=A0A1M5F3N3_9THEO|nr:DNA polymerase IV [Caldanaerobius fijiensis]SHF86124.1 DNA polymerase-4 [Caldanaerobius fijiensis DSM 17918]
MNRKIIHVDMDAFFASVEQHDNPELKGKPVIVGGISGRGVVATCSYEARKYGVHSAMPMYKARKLCPDGVFLPLRHSRYKEVSDRIFSILYGITDMVEPVSIDEAYLDVTGMNRDPVDIAREIKQKVREVTGLTVSAGISYNKFLAKLASDWNKPDGLMVITEDMVPDILRPLPVSKVYGIGEKSAKRLNDMGIKTIGDLLRLSQTQLQNIFGKYGIDIYNRIRGIDERPVIVTREAKSIGKETTLAQDTTDMTLLCRYLKKFAGRISEELLKNELFARTVTVKVKTADFIVHTKSKTVKDYIFSEEDIYKIAYGIMKEMNFKEKIRLIGLSVSNLSDKRCEQLSIFDENFQRRLKIERILNSVNKKLGEGVVKTAKEEFYANTKRK